MKRFVFLFVLKIVTGPGLLAFALWKITTDQYGRGLTIWWGMVGCIAGILGWIAQLEARKHHRYGEEAYDSAEKLLEQCQEVNERGRRMLDDAEGEGWKA